MNWVAVTVLLCATFLVPPTSAAVLEYKSSIGVACTGIIKGSAFAAVQSAAAIGKGYIGSSLLGFGSSGIAKGSIAAGLQSAGATGAGIAGSTLIPVVVAGVVCVSLVYMYRRRADQMVPQGVGPMDSGRTGHNLLVPDGVIRKAKLFLLEKAVRYNSDHVPRGALGGLTDPGRTGHNLLVPDEVIRKAKLFLLQKAAR